MKASIAVKTVFASFLNGVGIPDMLLGRRARGAAVLMYHRVLPREEARRRRVQAGMFVGPDALDAHLGFLADRFEIVPLAELPAALEGRGGGARPRCALTFDDGWRDFRDHAFPLLERHGVPATVFLATDYVGGKSRFWTDRLADLLARAEGWESSPAVRQADPLARRIATLNGSWDTRLEAAIAILKAHREEDIEEALDGLRRAGAPAGSNEARREFLSWDEVRETAASGLITYGSHTASHRILTTLSPGEVREELERSREHLLAEGAADPAFVPFCYPNGGCDARTAAMVRGAGYGLAVTTEAGWNRPGEDPFLLKRIGIHEDMASTRALFGCRVAGIL